MSISGCTNITGKNENEIKDKIKYVQRYVQKYTIVKNKQI